MTKKNYNSSEYFSAVIEQINIRCTLKNTANCDEQHALYRIVLT